MEQSKARTIIDRAYDAFIEIDIDSIIIDWNTRAELIFGWTKQEAIGKKLSDTIIPSQYREAHLKGLKHLKETGKGPVLNTKIEISALNRAGHEFPIELAIFPVSLNSITTFCAFIRDISDRKQAETTLKKANDALQEQADMLNLIYDAIILRDLDGTIRYWNVGAERMYGFTAEETIGKRTHDLLNTKFPKPLTEIEKNILEEHHWDGEILHYSKDGRRMIVYSRQSLKTNTNNQPIGILEINSDITVYKQAEQRRLALDEMKRINVELEQFAYITSHDLQEPLRGVAGALQILTKKYKDKLDTEADELINMAVDGANRMRTLIADILSLSQINSTKETFAPTDLSETLQQAMENLALIIKETSADITHDPLPILVVERTRFVQLFQNLISNAIKFRSDEIPKIYIYAINKDGQWQFSVKDNGIGFEQKFADRIFEPFKRLHGREKYPGNGIGLTICKRIVERHGGVIWVESEPGKGTTFYFTVPDTTK